jgi:hypothetical protein
MKLKLLLYSFSILLSLSILGGCVYYWLGGTDPVHVYRLEHKDKVIVGNFFQGRQTSKTIHEHFTTSRKLLLDSAVIGTLAQIYYQNDTLAGNELAVFTGIAITGNVAEVPLGFESRKIEAKEKYAVFLSMHPIVRPSPKKVEQMIQKVAAEDRVTLEKFLVEIHYYDNTLSVEAYIKE